MDTKGSEEKNGTPAGLQYMNVIGSEKIQHVRAIDQVIKSRGKSSGISGLSVGDMSYIVTRLFSKEQPTKWGHRPLLYRALSYVQPLRGRADSLPVISWMRCAYLGTSPVSR
jgi:hypothetical protein